MKNKFSEVHTMDCVFCHKEKIVTDIVYEDDLVMAFMDMEPINEGHVLLVPKEHYLDVDEIPDAILSHLMIISKKIVSALKEIYKPDGYSIMQNGGEFNDVGHYHLHIFPRYTGDGFGWTYGEEPKKVNAEIAKRIRGELVKLEFDKKVLFMKLENAELKHIERIVAISKSAFDSDIDVGASEQGGPPDYDSVAWHVNMQNEGHLLQAIIDGEIVGGAILFVGKDVKGLTLYVGRIFIDPIHYRKGYGIQLMKLVEKFYSGVRKIILETPLWNKRTNAFYQKLGYCEVKRDEEFIYYQKELD